MLLLILVSLSLTIWIYLIIFRGQFWLCNQYLKENKLENSPRVSVILPARNEAEVLPITLNSLFNQDYQGEFTIILIDDQSTDGTEKIAQEIAKKYQKSAKLNILKGQDLPEGWTGKLWAMKQGIEYAQQNFKPDYFLLTDADIKHSENNLSQLVAKAERDNLDLVSLMVLLRSESFWEKLLIPAFVFFFQKLYPFPWVNNPYNKTAAAAGGCILIPPAAWQRIGGIEVLKEALIDDCTLASFVKKTLPENKSIWLGLTNKTYSVRPYEDFAAIFNMVARTAFTQLNYSLLLLLGSILGMSIAYLIAPLGLMGGIITSNLSLVILSALTWLLMAIAYYPTLRLYKLSPLWGLNLPAIALLYSLMTVDSALRYGRGEGGKWKGRVYSKTQNSNPPNPT
jgi:hopene-associated glycosyltransferase HpnB